MQVPVCASDLLLGLVISVLIWALLAVVVYLAFFA